MEPLISCGLNLPVNPRILREKFVQASGWASGLCNVGLWQGTTRRIIRISPTESWDLHAREAIQQPINPTQIDLEEGVRKTLGVLFYDTDGQIGLEFGQTEERRLFFKPFNYLEQTAGTS